MRAVFLDLDRPRDARVLSIAPATTPAHRGYTVGPISHTAGIHLAKPNYSFEKRQREIAKKKQQDEKDARKREAREAAKAAADAEAKTPDSGN